MKYVLMLVVPWVACASTPSRAADRLENYQTFSVTMNKPLGAAKEALQQGVERCKPRWAIKCDAAACAIGSPDGATNFGKIEFIPLGEQTQVLLSVRASAPAVIRDQSWRRWLRYIEAPADACP